MISIQPISAPENQPALMESGIRRNFTSYEGRDHFLAVLEHELRSPLMPILAWIEVLKQEPNPSSGLQRALQAIERNVMRQRALVDDLLDLASIRNGKLECEQLPESIHQILSESVARYETPARNKGVKLEFSVNSKDAFVLGDRRRLSQICDNLLDNAVKFTPSGGRIGVRLSVVDKWIRLDVQDNGIGISPQFIADVFKSFTQGHSLASAHRRGLGLGLAIVKDLVERHHGRVEAFSEGENRGAKFSVHLPLHTTSGVDMPTPTPLPRPGKVLIVEDGEDTREAIRMLLESWGLSIAEAEDGAAGLRQIEQFQPDVVLCDLSMPVMDGWTMASEIRNRYPSRNIPLIALTGHGSASDVQQSLACGFQAHLVKPCEAKNMIAVLNQFLPATAIKIDPKNE